MGGDRLMGPASSRVPALLDALSVQIGGPLADDGWQVFDGPPGQQVLEPDVFVLGHAGLDSGASIQTQVERAQGLGHRHFEVFEISCVVSSVTGEDDGFALLRQRLLAGLSIIEGVLTSGSLVGSVVDAVQLGPSMEWAQASTEDGRAMDLLFSIVGKALL